MSLHALSLSSIQPSVGSDRPFATGRATLMDLPLHIEVSSGVFEHTAVITYLSPCCASGSGFSWAEVPIGSPVPCLTCGSDGLARFAAYDEVQVSLGSFWDFDGAAYSPDTTYTDEAESWLTRFLTAAGVSPLALDVAPASLLDELVTWMKRLPIPASTQDTSGWA